MDFANESILRKPVRRSEEDGRCEINRLSTTRRSLPCKPGFITSKTKRKSLVSTAPETSIYSNPDSLKSDLYISQANDAVVLTERQSKASGYDVPSETSPEVFTLDTILESSAMAIFNSSSSGNSAIT